MCIRHTAKYVFLTGPICNSLCVALPTFPSPGPWHPLAVAPAASLLSSRRLCSSPDGLLP